MAKVDRYFQPEYEIKHKNIKTGEHYVDKLGCHYTVVSKPVISTNEKKELALFCWENEELISYGKENLIAHLNAVEADKVESFTYPMDKVTIQDEKRRYYKLGKGLIEYLVDVQKFQVFIQTKRK